MSTDAERAEIYARWTFESVESVLFYLRRPLGKQHIATLRLIKATLKAALELVEHRLEEMKETA